ncbi:Hypothetical predicted protein [Pelobates cultripes]|uniref:Uncharacterized protein n=1 Tax=Pelobates cultripes TaxID=61616 RepID=A0AAD1R383_PELCU|nr:Hypothetical predicted protein [Pelobates cultripes]
MWPPWDRAAAQKLAAADTHQQKVWGKSRRQRLNRACTIPPTTPCCCVAIWYTNGGQLYVTTQEEGSRSAGPTVGFNVVLGSCVCGRSLLDWKRKAWPYPSLELGKLATICRHRLSGSRAGLQDTLWLPIHCWAIIL